MKLGIYGAGGLGREVYELAQQCNAHQTRWDGFFFVDDTITQETSLRGCPVHKLADAKSLFPPATAELVVAVGEPALRETLWNNALQAGYSMATLVYPGMHVPSTTAIGAGAVVCNVQLLSCDATIGQNVLLQPGCIIGHDCVVAEHSVVSIGATICGRCTIGRRAYVAAGSTVKETLRVGDNAVVGMGAVVFSDVTEGCVTLGNPARIIQRSTGTIFK